jgi:hypothetical protein
MLVQQNYNHLHFFQPMTSQHEISASLLSWVKKSGDDQKSGATEGP